MSSLDPHQKRSLIRIILIAFAVRLVVLAFLYPPRLSPDRDHYAFAFETGRIAQAIASGRGFSSPMPLPTGPTAWMAPVYPYFLAAIFRVWGIYTKSSAMAVLIFQDIFSALTCLPIFLIGKRCFGNSIGLNAAWIWAFFPYAIYVPNHWVWDASLAALLLAVLFLLTLHLESEMRLRDWVIYGFLWGVTALTNPVVLSVLPPILVWLWWRHRSGNALLSGRMALSLAIMCLLFAPWFIRNYLTFGRIVPFRSNFGAVLHMGNNKDLSTPRNDSLNPSENEKELAEFLKRGEMAYVDEKKQEAAQFIRSHPDTFAWLTGSRIVETWTGIWLPAPFDLFRSKWSGLKLVNALFCSAFSTFALVGLYRAFQMNNPAAWLCLIALFCFPLIYYIVSPNIRFRHPIDQQIVLLGAVALTKRKNTFEQIPP